MEPETIGLVFIILIFCGYFIFYQVSSLKEKKVYIDRAKRFIEQFYSRLEKSPSEYRYFTTGHPYTWVEVDINRFEKIVMGTIQYYPMLAGSWINYYRDPSVSLKIDEANSLVYIVPKGQMFQPKEFDFDSTKLVLPEEFGRKNRANSSNS